MDDKKNNFVYPIRDLSNLEILSTDKDMKVDALDVGIIVSEDKDFVYAGYKDDKGDFQIVGMNKNDTEEF